MKTKVSNRRIVISSVLIVLSIIFSSIIYGQVATIPNPKFDKVRAKIMEAVTSGELPSMSVAAAKDGKIIWEESFGWANREKMIKATPNTMYSMASVSKPITTTGLMILVEQGLVDLDAPVNQYIAPAELTAYEGDANAATVTHILNHTSGLAEHYTCYYLDQPRRQPPVKSESIRRYGVLVHPPGEVYQYANFGFSLADYIIKKVSGMSYKEFMKTKVFLPLGMTHTAIDVPPELSEYAAERYDSDGTPVPFYISDHPGASQVYCSVHDLIRFGMFHLKDHLSGQKQILKDKTIDLMHKDSDPNPDNNRYGLGWFLRDDDFGYSVVWHTGSMRGVNNMLKFIPSENIAVAVLLNTNSELRNKIPNDMIGVLLPDFDREWQKIRDKPREEEKPYHPTMELIGTWKGEIKTYDEIVPVAFEFQEDGDIHVAIEKQMSTLLDHAVFENGFLTGRCYGTIPSSDARQFPHDIYVKILKKGDRLSGFVSTTIGKADRSYGNFSYYIWLNKQSEVSSNH